MDRTGWGCVRWMYDRWGSVQRAESGSRSGRVRCCRRDSGGRRAPQGGGRGCGARGEGEGPRPPRPGHGRSSGAAAAPAKGAGPRHGHVAARPGTAGLEPACGPPRAARGTLAARGAGGQPPGGRLPGTGPRPRRAAGCVSFRGPWCPPTLAGGGRRARGGRKGSRPRAPAQLARDGRGPGPHVERAGHEQRP